jgi:hypothetical protein
MSYVPLEQARFTIEPTLEGEVLTIPAVRNIFIMLFMSFWLAMWTIGGIAGIAETDAGNVNGLTILGVVAWALGWLYAVSIVLWMLTGREIVRITGGDLHMTRRAFGLGRRWVYRAASIRNLCVEPRPWLGTTKGGIFPFFPYSRFGAIRFAYRGGTRDLALGLAETEARAIHNWLKKRLPGDE